MPIKPQTTLVPSSLFAAFQEYQLLHGKERGEALFNEKFNEIERKSTDLNIIESDYLEFYLSFFYYCLPTKSPPDDYLVSIEGISEKNHILKYNISKDQNLYEHHFRTLFTKMQLPNILKLIKFCLLEKSIIIFSSNPNETIAITETLLSLINPLYIRKYKIYIKFINFLIFLIFITNFHSLGNGHVFMPLYCLSLWCKSCRL